MGDLSVTKTTKEASSHFFFEGNVDWWSSIKFLKNITMNNTMNTTIIGEFLFFGSIQTMKEICCVMKKVDMKLTFSTY